MKRFELIVKNIYKGDTRCVNPILVFEPLSSCVSIVCVTMSSDKSIWTVSVDIDDERFDCEKCIRYIIRCDGCPSCPTKEAIKCYCNNSDDCPNCTTCVNGDCIPKCPGLCDPSTEDCIDCDENHPCPCNQQCVQGKCICAPGLILNDQGCCVACQSKEDCPPCSVCLGGECVPVECPDGACDPDTGNCVECYNSGQCTGDHMCCINNKCTCCPGYQWDLLTLTCIEIPECTSDKDCLPCEVCVDGTCTPIVCPDGYECKNGKCLKPCEDCSNSNCPQNSICYALSPGECFCVECSGPCINGECDPGCICNNGQCKPNRECEGPCVNGNDCGPNCGCVNNRCVPCNTFTCLNGTCPDGCDCGDHSICGPKQCKGNCLNAEDCGPGCGCLNGTCVSCSFLDCNDCQFVIGCICTNNACISNPCAGSCVSGDDCGPGCGCLNGQCVPCNSVTCSTTTQCPEGCICKNGGCATNPCSNTYCENEGDCGQGCTCLQGRCVSCSSLSCVTGECAQAPGCACIDGSCGDDGGNPNCDNNLSITKVDASCDLKATLATQDCCNCDSIGNGHTLINYSNSSNTIEFDIRTQLRKGSVSTYPNFLSNPLLSSTGVSNELPIGGTLRFTLASTLKESDSNGVYIPNGAVIQVTDFISTSFANDDQVDTSFTNIAGIGKVVNVGGKYYVVIELELSVESINTFSFPNTCTYALPKKRLWTISNNSQFGTFTGIAFEFLKTSLCRNPLFTWFKASSPSNLMTDGNIFRRFYAPKVGNLYTDTLYTSGDLLEYGKYYAVKSDCGCDKSENYSCYGNEGQPTKLVFCNPTDFLFHLEDCGTKLVFDSDVAVTCDVYTAGTKPTYLLYFNGLLKQTKVLPGGNILYEAGDEITSVAPITSVDLKIQGDECHDCDIHKTPTTAPLTVDVTMGIPHCDLQETVELKISFTGGEGPYDYEVKKDGITFSTGTAFSNPVVLQINNADGTYSATVTDTNGCTGTDSVSYQVSTLTMESKVNIDHMCTPDGTGYIIVENSFNETLMVVILGLTHSIPANSNHNYNVGYNPGNIPVTVYLQSTPACTLTVTENVDCCNPNPADSLDFHITFNCAQGLQWTDIAGWTLSRDGVALVKGQRPTGLTGSEIITIDVSNGICTGTKEVEWTECFYCVQDGSATCVSDAGGFGPSGTVYYDTIDTCGDHCTACNGVGIVINQVPQSPLTTQYCHDRSLRYLASLGTAPYIYQLNGVYPDNDPTGAGLGVGVYAHYDGYLPGGNYNLVVTDANGCKTYLTTAVPCPLCFNPPFVIGTNRPANYCMNGIMTASLNSVTSGHPPYRYKLDGSTNPTNDPSGTGLALAVPAQFTVPIPYGLHTITVTDNNGCTAETSFDVNCDG